MATVVNRRGKPEGDDQLLRMLIQLLQAGQDTAMGAANVSGLEGATRGAREALTPFAQAGQDAVIGAGNLAGLGRLARGAGEFSDPRYRIPGNTSLGQDFMQAGQDMAMGAANLSGAEGIARAGAGMAREAMDAANSADMWAEGTPQWWLSKLFELAGKGPNTPVELFQSATNVAGSLPMSGNLSPHQLLKIAIESPGTIGKLLAASSRPDGRPAPGATAGATAEDKKAPAAAPPPGGEGGYVPGGSDMDIVNHYRAMRGEINAPGSENWIRWSDKSQKGIGPLSNENTGWVPGLSPVANEYMPRFVKETPEEIMARHANSGNRPSDILARQMYEKDKQLKQALAFMASPMPERRKMGAAMLEAYKAGEDIKTAVEDRETAAEDRELGLQAGSREAAIKENEAAIKNAKTQAEADYLRAQASNIGRTEPFQNADQRLAFMQLLASQLAASSGLSEKDAKKQEWKFIAMLLPKIFPELAEMGLDIGLEE